MRIDNHLLITGENRAATGDLMSRLEAGDVISAKVLEISPGEAVLRLSDGSVIKAGTNEPLDVKPGQTISLSVSSRTESSITLETVKTTSQTIPADTGRLQKMLEALGVKTNKLNMNLAAEFLKYDIKPTAENLTDTIELMKASKGPNDIEKAVFLTVKNISTSQVNKNMLDGLLSGNIKLGNLLESLYKALNSYTKGSDIQNSEDVTPTFMIHTNAENAENEASQQTEQVQVDSNTNESTNLTSSNAQFKEKLAIIDQSDREVFDAAPSHAATNSSQTATREVGTDTLATNPGKTMDSGAIAIQTEEALSNTNTTSNTEQKTVDLPTGLANSSKEIGPNSELDTDFANKNTGPVADYANKIVSVKASNIKNSHDYIDKKQAPALNVEKSLLNINESIEKLYVNINKQLSGAELDSGNIKNKLFELVNELNTLVQSSANSQAKNVQVATSVNLVEDTIKLLDMFNSNNVLYYQIPVKLDDYKSTAELYIMKRNHNKKKIDPNNSVLFLSLDTKNMGRIETILDIKGRNISISLRTESQTVSEFAKANIIVLYSALSDCGYKLADIKYSVIGSASTPAQQEKLLVDALRLKHGKVDLRI